MNTCRVTRVTVFNHSWFWVYARGVTQGANNFLKFFLSLRNGWDHLI